MLHKQGVFEVRQFNGVIKIYIRPTSVVMVMNENLGILTKK